MRTQGGFSELVMAGNTWVWRLWHLKEAVKAEGSLYGR